MTKPDLIPEPATRDLRIFAFDPGVSAQYSLSTISELTIGVPWEKNLLAGPVGEYVEVVDVDPASGVYYKPVDLNDPRILAQDGLPPSENNPQFHQQMVYAVAMTTILNFEQALGRVALWSTHQEQRGGDLTEEFVRRLRIYPHALRDRNAYYSPDKKALLFGYFPVGIKDEHNTPGTRVYTCLSHDIIAHETTHALLDGVHPRFNKPLNADVFAFHEAFADIVALFQHFSYPGILRDQIARTRGNLADDNLLGQLAQQFGMASGRGRALRDYLGKEDENHVWHPITPDVHALENIFEAHERGAVLVAAVFGAFLKIYRARTLDLFRIASEGTGVLREGDIHPDLANRLAVEAARAAQQVLQTCIRAIDYCPPVGITFGDYLRAIVTADYDLNLDDSSSYRLAFVESFRQWGIQAVGQHSMSVEALLWPTGEEAGEEVDVQISSGDLQSLFTGSNPFDVNEQGVDRRSSDVTNSDRFKSWTLDSDRYQTWEGVGDNARVLWRWLVKGQGKNLALAIGIVRDDDNPPLTAYFPSNRYRSDSVRRIGIEVHSVRSAIRRSRRGAPTTDLVVEVTQRRRGFFDRDEQKKMDAPGADINNYGDFRIYAGCTLFINPTTMEVRRVIKTPGKIDDDEYLDRVRHFLTEGGLSPQNAFDFPRDIINAREPFAFVHSNMEQNRYDQETRDRKANG